MARSPALVMDKDTGEPKLLPTQLGKDPWMVIIYHELKGRRGKKFARYSHAKRMQAKMQKKYRPEDGWVVCIVSRQVGYGPPYSKITDKQIYQINLEGKYWCAFCRAFREFEVWVRFNKYRCPVCHTSTEDEWHTRMNNPVFWGKDVLKNRGIIDG